MNLKFIIKKDLTNNGGETIHKGDLVEIKSIWSNDSNAILYCEVYKDSIIIFCELKDII